MTISRRWTRMDADKEWKHGIPHDRSPRHRCRARRGRAFDVGAEVNQACTHV